MNCETCKERQKQAEPIPFVAYESGMARMERSNKRLWIIIIILAVMLFGSNIAWTIYENQFEEVTTTESYEATTDDGGTAIANGSGEVRYYGAGEVHENDNDP